MTSNGIMERTLKSLGRGFDLTSDFRLKFCKGEKRLVFLSEAEKKELEVPGFGAIKDVSIDIKCDKGDRVRYQSDILEFQQRKSADVRVLQPKSIRARKNPIRAV